MGTQSRKRRINALLLMAAVSINDHTMNVHEKSLQMSFVRSQLSLFQSRKKFGLLYALATVAGLFCIPGTLGAMAAETNIMTLVLRTAPLPLISFLVSIGMYILNDLVDVNLDRANKKKRPIPSGQVSKRQAWSFILLTNSIGVALAVFTVNTATMVLAIPMIAIGIIYSAPKISLMRRFVTKNVTIAVFYILCALLGMTSIYGFEMTVSNTVAVMHALTVLGIMIFVGSIINDLGDIKGDKMLGRRTVPVVLGGEKTTQVLVVILAAMSAISWALLVSGAMVGILTVLAISTVTVLAIARVWKIREGLGTMDADFMRRQHKKWFPLHMLLHSGLIIGAIMV